MYNSLKKSIKSRRTLDDYFDDIRYLPEKNEDGAITNAFNAPVQEALNLDEKSNLKVGKTKNGIFFKEFKVTCPKCDSSNVTEDGYDTREIQFVEDGKMDCDIYKYKCDDCDESFTTDISDLVCEEFSVSNRIMEIIRDDYEDSKKATPEKISKRLRIFVNVDLSVQEVKKILKYMDKL